MKKIVTLSTLGFFALVLVAINLVSCSSNKGIASTHELRNTSHQSMAMHAKGYQQPSEAKEEKIEAPQQTVESVKPEGTASLNNDITNIKSAKGLFSMLTKDERQQVRDQFSSMLAGKPLMKKVALNKWDKMDAKYPAPAQSVLHPGGGGLTLGEILAIVAIACCVTWVLGIAGLIIGIIALIKCKSDGSRNWARIISIVAIVLGAIDLLTFIIWIALFAIAVGTVGVI